jgi:hypothetical protein
MRIKLVRSARNDESQKIRAESPICKRIPALRCAFRIKPTYGVPNSKGTAGYAMRPKGALECGGLTPPYSRNEAICLR